MPGGRLPPGRPGEGGFADFTIGDTVEDQRNLEDPIVKQITRPLEERLRADVKKDRKTELSSVDGAFAFGWLREA